MKQFIGTALLTFFLSALIYQSANAQPREQLLISHGFKDGFNIRLEKSEGSWYLQVFERVGGSISDDPLRRFNLETDAVEIWGGDRRNTFRITGLGSGRLIGGREFVPFDPNRYRFLTKELLELDDNSDVKLFATTDLTADLAIIGMEDMRDSRLEPPHDSVPGVIRPDSWEKEVVVATLDYLKFNRKRVRLWVEKKIVNGKPIKHLVVHANTETKAHYTTINPCDFTHMMWGNFDNDYWHTDWCKYYAKSGKEGTKALKDKSKVYSPMLIDEGSIDKTYIRWLASAGKCFEQSEIQSALENEFQGFFYHTAEEFNPCFITDVMYTLDVTDTPANIACDEELVDRLEIILGELESKGLSKELSQEYITRNAPYSAYYRTTQTVDGDSSILPNGEDPLEYFATSSEISNLNGFDLLEPVFDEEGKLAWRAEFDVETADSSIVQSVLSLEHETELHDFVPKDDGLSDSLLAFDGLDVSLKTELLKVSHQLGIALAEDFEVKLKSFAPNAQVRKINLTGKGGICEGAGAEECLKYFQRYIVDHSKYLQDRYHVRDDGTYTYLNPSYSTIGLGPDQIEAYFTQSCDDKITGQAGDPLVGLQGGNMFVLDDVVFVGKDEIRRYLSSYDCNIDTTEQANIDTAVMMAVYGPNYDKDVHNIVWLGTKCPINRYRRLTNLKQLFYQPIYHIDMFFQPIGDLGDGKFTYVFANPVLSNTDLSSTDSIVVRFNRLFDQMKQVKDTLKFDLEEIYGIGNVNVIEVDIQVDYYERPDSRRHALIKSYSNWLNGFFWIQIRDKVKYLEYLEPVRKGDLNAGGVPQNQNLIDFETAVRDGVDAINSSVTVNIRHVLGEYSQISGLRCEVKVLGRE